MSGCQLVASAPPSPFCNVSSEVTTTRILRVADVVMSARLTLNVLKGASGRVTALTVDAGRVRGIRFRR